MLPASFSPAFLRQLELVRLHARRSFLGSREGGHVSLKRGHGIVFSDYRTYELGDNPRHIDWGLYARSDRLYVKRFQEEQDLKLHIFIDTSNSMRTPAQDQKFERASEIALALAYIALMGQDTVSIICPGLWRSPACYGGRSLHTLSRNLLELKQREKQGEVSDFPAQCVRAINPVRYPGLAVFISDLLMPFEDLQKIFNALRAKNLDVTCIQVLGPHDLQPLKQNSGPESSAIAIDSESGEEVELFMNESARLEYELLLQEHNQKLRNFFAAANVGFTATDSHAALEDFVFSSLPTTGLLQ